MRLSPAPLAVLAVLGAACLAAVALAQGARPVFDGRLSLTPARAEADDEAFFRKVVLPGATRFWTDRDGEPSAPDPGEARIEDVAQGAFTRAGASQRALLYRFRETGHGLGRSGVAILDEGRLAAHIVYEGGTDHAVGALPDLDGNGLSELVLASGGTNMGQTWKSLAILGISGNAVASLGRTLAYADDCGAGRRPGRARAWRILAVPAAPPEFQREAFLGRAGCDGSAGWTRQGPPARFSLDADETEYTLLQ